MIRFKRSHIKLAFHPLFILLCSFASFFFLSNFAVIIIITILFFLSFHSRLRFLARTPPLCLLSSHRYVFLKNFFLLSFRLLLKDRPILGRVGEGIRDLQVARHKWLIVIYLFMSLFTFNYLVSGPTVPRLIYKPPPSLISLFSLQSCSCIFAPLFNIALGSAFVHCVRLHQQLTHNPYTETGISYPSAYGNLMNLVKERN